MGEEPLRAVSLPLHNAPAARARLMWRSSSVTHVAVRRNFDESSKGAIPSFAFNSMSACTWEIVAVR